MVGLLGRLLASLVILFSFSLLAAWAWDKSDHASRAHPPAHFQTVADSHTPQEQL